MNRRFFLKALSGLALCPVCAPASFAAESAHPPHWSYEGTTGPAAWGDLDAASKACTVGSQQSPINLQSAIKARIDAIDIKWQRSADTIVNNGHTIQVNFTPGSTLLLGRERFTLVQVHFHRPSEHLIDGKNFPMEAHFVHSGDKGLAVVGVMLTPGSANPAFATIAATMPQKEGPAVKADASLDVRKLLPAGRSYYRYEGSLTTPPCSEVVEWLVMADPVTVAEKDIAAFAKLYPMNARPVQTGNRRFVLRSL